MARRKKKQGEKRKEEGHARRLLRRFLEQARASARRETSRWGRFKLWVWRERGLAARAVEWFSFLFKRVS